MEFIISICRKALFIYRKQGLPGLLASVASKTASILVDAANRLGSFAARNRRFYDDIESSQEEGRPTATGGPPSEPVEIWIDVGAHLGELTLNWAREHPDCTVYAFEPNIKAASQVVGLLPNFIVFPFAVSTKDGFETFYENANEETSSLLPIDAEVRKFWIKGNELEVINSWPVPSIRLDTFMGIMSIPRVDFLKIDAQGYDYDVVVSCGERLKDVRRIQLEVTVTEKQFYRGAKGKPEIVDFLSGFGFLLQEEQAQTYGMEENLIFTRE